MKVDKIRLNLPFLTFLAIVGFIISSTAVFVTVRNNFENRITNLERQVDKNTSEIEDVRNIQIDTKITLTELMTDVKWMRAMMEDMYNKGGDK